MSIKITNELRLIDVEIKQTKVFDNVRDNLLYHTNILLDFLDTLDDDIVGIRNIKSDSNNLMYLCNFICRFGSEKYLSVFDGKASCHQMIHFLDNTVFGIRNMNNDQMTRFLFYSRNSYTAAAIRTALDLMKSNGKRICNYDCHLDFGDDDCNFVKQTILGKSWKTGSKTKVAH